MARKAKTDDKYLAGHKKIFGYKYSPQQVKTVSKIRSFTTKTTSGNPRHQITSH
jgi:hypothetical protein